MAALRQFEGHANDMCRCEQGHYLIHNFNDSCSRLTYSSIQLLLHFEIITSDPNNGEDHILERNRANIIMDETKGMCTLQIDSGHCRSDPVQVQSTGKLMSFFFRPENRFTHFLFQAPVI